MIKYDTIVVGSGSAGAVVATRLSENPSHSVLLLEAGLDYPNIDELPEEIKWGYGRHRNLWAKAFGKNSEHSWNLSARATDHNPNILVPRGKIVGGSSAINAQIFLRGDPDDYDAWDLNGNSGWSFDELLPFFCKLEKDVDFNDEFHGDNGPIVVRRFKEQEWNEDQNAFYKACIAAGYKYCPDHNAPHSTGVGPTPLNNNDGVRWGTHIGYIADARSRTNFTLKSNCFVHKLIFDGNRAIGVVVENENDIFSIYANEIILSAGTVGSAHILLLSGVGPADQIENQGIPVVLDMPGVGKNLRDHPQAHVTWRKSDHFKQDENIPRVQMALRYTAGGSDLQNDMIIHMFSSVTPGGRFILSDSAPIGFSMVVCIELALGTGELSLISPDPHIQPKLNYNYLTNSFDRNRLKEGVRICADLGNSSDFAHLIKDRMAPSDKEISSDSNLEEWVLNVVQTSHHISGTCKMGVGSDNFSVVNQYGLVHGIEGLRVADASIMPDSVRANINATTIAIGERISDLICKGF